MPVSMRHMPFSKELIEDKVSETKPMKHLYFQHSNGEMTLIEKNIDEYGDEIIFTLIQKDLKNRNSEFIPTKHDVWIGYGGKRYYDVGSKTEKYIVF